MSLEYVNKLQTGDILPQEFEQFHVKLLQYVVLLHFCFRRREFEISFFFINSEA